jgi:hypothetical protein
MNDLFRYLRQMQIIGEPRQRALMQSHVVVRGEALDGLIEALYLIGAGVGTGEVATAELARVVRALNPAVTVTVFPARAVDVSETAEFADELSGFADEIAKDAARGALRALRALGDTLPAKKP